MLKVAVAIAAALLASGAVDVEAQEAGKTYRIPGSIEVRQFDPLVDRIAAGATAQRTTDYALIEYVKEIAVGDVVYGVFRFLPYKGTTERSTWNEGKFFTAPKSVLVGVEEAFAWGFRSGDVAIGALALPAILRFTPFNFSGAVALGPSIAYRWRVHPVRDYSAGLVLSVGTSSVQLNSDNTRGKVEDPIDRSAYYWAIGIMGELNRFQVGVFTGSDRINDPNRHDWVYQGERWLSVGVGAALFGAPTSKPAGKNPG